MNEDNAGRAFIRATYYENMPGQSDQDMQLPQPPLERPADPGKKNIPLTKAGSLKIPSMDLRAAIENRRSVRAYADVPLNLDELSWLLWASQGVEKTGFAMGSHRTYRTVPSAGARHPLETYLVLRAVSGVAPGIYRYLALDHILQEVDVSTDYSKDIAFICKEQAFIEKAAATFVWMADEYRGVWRFRARAYRHFFLDAGHVGQNLYLAASNIGCGACGIGVFDDLALARLLGADDKEFFPVYAATVGKLKRLPAEPE